MRPLFVTMNRSVCILSLQYLYTGDYKKLVDQSRLLKNIPIASKPCLCIKLHYSVFFTPLFSNFKAKPPPSSMAPTTNFAIAHEYAKARSPRRISSNGWSRSEIVLKKTEEDESNEERDEVELLMKKSSSGMQGPRVCANCRTSKTPLWRSGPTGPKSLCNACGIRFRKRQLEVDAGKNPLPFFTLAGEEASSESPANVLTLEEMKELQKAKQRRILRFIAKHRVQEIRRRLLERSSRDMMQVAQLLVSLSKGAT